MSQDVESLRRNIYLEDIASRMAAGDSPRKIARETNQRPDVLKKLIRSDEFLAVLQGFDKELADDIRAERDAAKPTKYEELILEEAARSVERLAQIRDYGEAETAQVSAAKAIIDIAEKVKKVHKEETNRRTSFPASQLKSLVEVTREIKAMEQRAGTSARKSGPTEE